MAIKWICRSLSEDESDIRFGSLENSTHSVNNIRLDILRNCYQNQVLVASNCKSMAKILPIIEECRTKRNHGILQSCYYCSI